MAPPTQDEVDKEVKMLLALKAQYKSLTGDDLAGGGQGRKGGKGGKKGGAEGDKKGGGAEAGGKKDKNKQQKQEKKVEEGSGAGGGEREVKKVSRWVPSRKMLALHGSLLMYTCVALKCAV